MNGDSGNLPTDGPVPVGFDEVSLQNLVNELGKVVQNTQGECPPPNISAAIPVQSLSDLFNFMCGMLAALGVSQFIAHLLAGTVLVPLVALNAGVSIIISIVAPVLAALVGQLLAALDEMRKDLEPSVQNLSVTVLNELLGTDLQVGQVVTGMDMASHIDRAGVIGGLFHNTLIKEFTISTPLDPSDGATNARIFSGMVINFGTVTGTLALLGGLVPFAHIDEIREIGENVARNLGLGRLARLAMQPLIHTLIQLPYSWYFNLQYRPTTFTPAECFNQFALKAMSPTIVHDSLARAGYSDDKIAELIVLHQKEAGVDPLLRAYRYKEISRESTLDLMGTLNYSPSEAAKVVTNYERERLDTHVDGLISAILDAVKFGNVEPGEVQSLLQALPLFDSEINFILARANYLRKTPHRSLTVAQLESAVEQDIMALDEFEAYLATLGFSTIDAIVIEQLTLLKQKKQEAAAAAKARGAAAKAAKAAAGAVTTTTTATNLPPSQIA